MATNYEVVRPGATSAMPSSRCAQLKRKSIVTYERAAHGTRVGPAVTGGGTTTGTTGGQ